MKRYISTLLLITALGIGLLLGPHPCGTWHVGQEGAKASSCHEETASHGGPQLSQSQHEGGGDCCGTLCQHACHLSAITAAEPVAFTIAAVSEAATEPSGSGLPLFANPIDHIPLP